VLNDVIHVFKTREEWFILKEKTFSFKESGKQGITECYFGSIQVTTYVHDNEIQQHFINIPRFKRHSFYHQFILT
jgi:hypothetical protein